MTLDTAIASPDSLPKVSILALYAVLVPLIVILYPSDVVSMLIAAGRVQFIETAMAVWQAIQLSLVFCSIPYLIKAS